MSAVGDYSMDYIIERCPNVDKAAPGMPDVALRLCVLHGVCFCTWA